jgi:RNA polymerase sigma-70 factor (ECF subfamily)
VNSTALPADEPDRARERDLLERLRASEQDAYEAIFRAHYARLVSLAEHMLHDRAAAEETVQEVMLELWRRRETIQVESTLQAYLYRATRNRALNHIRHERVVRRAEPLLAPDPVSARRADDRVIEGEMKDALRIALDAMPPRCREVFELSRVHGLKYADIARVLDISVKTVEAQMGKALRIVRDGLAAWLPSTE